MIPESLATRDRIRLFTIACGLLSYGVAIILIGAPCSTCGARESGMGFTLLKIFGHLAMGASGWVLFSALIARSKEKA